MKLKWRTKTGEEIPITRMTTTHIENCIALMERTGNDGGLLYTYDEDGMPWADQGRNPVYDALVFELQRRIVMGAKT